MSGFNYALRIIKGKGVISNHTLLSAPRQAESQILLVAHATESIGGR